MSTDTTADIAQAITDQINNSYSENGTPALPVTAVATTGAVDLTATFKGVNGNEITIFMNYYGSIGSEITPPGLGITLPVGGLLSGGVGAPVMSNAISAIQKDAFEYVAMPYTDTNSLFEWDQEYGFTDQGRWGWERQQFGHIFSAKRGTYADLILFGDTLNSGVESIMGFEQTTISPMFEAAAAYLLRKSSTP